MTAMANCPLKAGLLCPVGRFVDETPCPGCSLAAFHSQPVPLQEPVPERKAPPWPWSSYSLSDLDCDPPPRPFKAARQDHKRPPRPDLPRPASSRDARERAIPPPEAIPV